MKNAIVISKTEQINLSFEQLLKHEGYDSVICVTDSQQVKSMLDMSEYDLILINAPIGDDSGLGLAVHCAKNSRSCVFVTVPHESYDKVSESVGEYGVFVISRPLNKNLFHHYLMFTDYFKKRILGLLKENDKLKDMVEELGIINRAKMLLMQCLMMSEEQAHRYLEQQAMNLRVSKKEAALQVIKTYQN